MGLLKVEDMRGFVSILLTEDQPIDQGKGATNVIECLSRVAVALERTVAASDQTRVVLLRIVKALERGPAGREL